MKYGYRVYHNHPHYGWKSVGLVGEGFVLTKEQALALFESGRKRFPDRTWRVKGPHGETVAVKYRPTVFVSHIPDLLDLSPTLEET